MSAEQTGHRTSGLGAGTHGGSWNMFHEQDGHQSTTDPIGIIIF